MKCFRRPPGQGKEHSPVRLQYHRLQYVRHQILCSHAYTTHIGTMALPKAYPYSCPVKWAWLIKSVEVEKYCSEIPRE